MITVTVTSSKVGEGKTTVLNLLYNAMKSLKDERFTIELCEGDINKAAKNQIDGKALKAGKICVLFIDSEKL